MAAANRTARPETSGYVGARACLALCLVAAVATRASEAAPLDFGPEDDAQMREFRRFGMNDARHLTVPLSARGAFSVAAARAGDSRRRRRALLGEEAASDETDDPYATLPLHGSVKEHGYYYVDVSLGTPPKSFQVIVDTGSTLTYVPCADCGSDCGAHTGAPKFDPDPESGSQTCERVRCRTEDCHDVGRCAAGSDACEYSKSYAEHSSVRGRLVKDKVHLGGTLVPEAEGGLDVVFGCTTRETGSIHGQDADGLMGLGNGVDSFPSQLARRYGLEDVFSLCYGAFAGGGAVTFGKLPGFDRGVEGDAGETTRGARNDTLHPGEEDVREPTGILRYTPLLRSAAHPSYYVVQTLDWSLGTERVAGENDFTTGYGTVLDSGTTFTYVTTPVFENFVAVLDAAVVAPGALKRVDGPDPSYPDDVCYAADAAAPPLTEASLADAFPNLTLRFAGDDVTLALPPKNYLFAHGGVAGAFCLGVMDNGRAGTLLGGITARDVLVEYDLTGEGRVGMAVTDCAHVLDSSSARGDAAANATAANAATGTAAASTPGSDAGAGADASPPPPAPPPSPPPGSPSAASDSVAPGGYIALVFLVGAGFAVVHYGRRAGWLDEDSDGGGAGGAALRTAAKAASRGNEIFQAKWDELKRTVGSAPAGYARFGLDGERPRGRHGVELPPLLARR